MHLSCTFFNMLYTYILSTTLQLLFFDLTVANTHFKHFSGNGITFKTMNQHLPFHKNYKSNKASFLSDRIKYGTNKNFSEISFDLKSFVPGKVQSKENIFSKHSIKQFILWNYLRIFMRRLQKNLFPVYQLSN